MRDLMPNRVPNGFAERSRLRHCSVASAGYPQCRGQRTESRSEIGKSSTPRPDYCPDSRSQSGIFAANCQPAGRAGWWHAGRGSIAPRCAILAWTLPAMLIQAVCLILPGRAKIGFARLYWAIFTRLIGIRVRIIGTPSSVRAGGRWFMCPIIPPGSMFRLSAACSKAVSLPRPMSRRGRLSA